MVCVELRAGLDEPGRSELCAVVRGQRDARLAAARGKSFENRLLDRRAELAQLQKPAGKNSVKYVLVTRPKLRIKRILANSLIPPSSVRNPLRVGSKESVDDGNLVREKESAA